MTQKTAEQRAEERYPDPSEQELKTLSMVPGAVRECGIQTGMCQAVWATCIREQVEPLEAEVVRLRALVQFILDQGDGLAALIEVNTHFTQGDRTLHWQSHVDTWAFARNRAKEHGIVPTNTTEG